MPPDDFEVDLTSGDEDPVDSDVSENGVPDGELNFIIDDKVSARIIDRRKNRRLSKIQARIESEAIRDVLKVTERFHEPVSPTQGTNLTQKILDLTADRRRVQTKLSQLLNGTEMNSAIQLQPNNRITLPKLGYA